MLDFVHNLAATLRRWPLYAALLLLGLLLLAVSGLHGYPLLGDDQEPITDAGPTQVQPGAPTPIR